MAFWWCINCSNDSPPSLPVQIIYEDLSALPHQTGPLLKRGILRFQYGRPIKPKKKFAVSAAVRERWNAKRSESDAAYRAANIERIRERDRIRARARYERKKK